MAVPLILAVSMTAAALLVDYVNIPAPARDPLASLRDSLTVARTVDSIRLVTWADSVVQLRGDSLAAVASRRAATLRPRVVRLVEVDTLRDTVLLPGADLRTLLVADSLCWDSVGALRGELVGLQAERAFEGEQAAHEVSEARRRGWWYAAGALAVGLAIGALSQ